MVARKNPELSRDCRDFLWMLSLISGAKFGYEKVHGRRGGKSRAWKEAQLACFNQFRSLSGGFHVTSSPPCWWTVNKRSLISSLCLSTSICSFHRGYLCLPRLHENHFLAQASKLSVTLVEASSLLVKFAGILWRCAWVVKYQDPIKFDGLLKVPYAGGGFFPQL